MWLGFHHQMCFSMQCSESCWSETHSGPWNSGMSDICRRGECRMGHNYASWVCHSMSGNGGMHQPKGSMNCLQWLGEECDVCLLKLLLLLSWWEQLCDCNWLKCSHIHVHSGWSVFCLFGCGYIIVLNETCLGGMVFQREESCLGSPVQSG